MDPTISTSFRHIRMALKKTIRITTKVEKKQEFQIYNVPIRELSHSLKCLRSILHEFHCRNAAVPRRAIPTAAALTEIKSLLSVINHFFEMSPTKLQDIIECLDQLYDYHRRIVEKILLFQNANLSGELTVTQSLLLTVGILSPQMPLLHSGPHEEEHQQLMKERTIPNSSRNGSDALIFMSSPVQEGNFVGYYTYNHEPIIVGAGPTRLIVRFDLKMKILLEEEEEGSAVTGHFRVEMGQFDNELQTASLRNHSFVKTYEAAHFQWQKPSEGGRKRLSVQKWQFGGEWGGGNLDMDCAECLGNFLLDELDGDLSLDGVWYGFYFSGGEPEPSNEAFHLTIQSSRTSQGVIRVIGEGTDQHGTFDIEGHLFRDALLKKLEFRKLYFFYDTAGTRRDRFCWDYKGLVEAGDRGVTGTWGVGSRPQGSFAMARVD